jgi:hypothetical protein
LARFAVGLAGDFRDFFGAAFTALAAFACLAGAFE